MKPESPPRCARCGEAPVEGHREEMPVCPTCEAIVLRDLLAERERELVALRHDLAQARAQRGAAERQAAANYARADELRRAAAALIDGLVKASDGHSLSICDQARRGEYEGCGVLATKRDDDTFTELCDACAEYLAEEGADPLPPLEDLPHAAPLRALRALLGRTP